MSCSICIHEAAACLYYSFLSRFAGVNWANEARLVGIATLLTRSYFQLNKVLLTSLQTYRHIEYPLPLLHGTGRHSLQTLLANHKFVCQFSRPPWPKLA